MTSLPTTRPARSRRAPWWGRAACAVALLLLACSVGVGEGSVTGSVRIDECLLDTDAFSLGPNFFAGEFVEEPENLDPITRLRQLNIRIQRGSWRESDSDGLLVSVRDVNEIATSMIGTPIALEDVAEAPVYLTLYLGQTCESGFPRAHWVRSAILAADSGTITFEGIYAPAMGDPDPEIAATFENVHFSDVGDPDGREALLSGEFRFVFQRGRPAQRFQ